MTSNLKTILLILLSIILAVSSAGCADIIINDLKGSFVSDERENEKAQMQGYSSGSSTNPPQTTESTTPVPTDEHSNKNGWTVMIYLNGSNLESEAGAGEATKNLNTLLSIPLPENIHVIIYTGGTKKWQNSVIDPTKNQIWEVEDGSLKLLKTYNKKSIGESSTLSEFMEFAQPLYPNTRRALLFWNHGGGSIIGFGVDEHFDGDSLYLSEISDAFISGFDGTKYDLIGFDACLMGCIEVASILAPYADYLVASEENVPGGGFNYKQTFTALKDSPNLSGLDFGIAITDGYYAKYEHTEYESYTTCSVIDLKLIPALETELGNFAAQLTTDIQNPQHLSTIASARQRSESYGEEPGSVSLDIVDLYNFVELQQNINPTLSENLLSAIEDAVVYEVSGSQRLYSYGLSIYFPFSSADYFSICLDIYGDIKFCTEYNKFIADFASQLTSQSYLSYVPEYEPEAEATGVQDFDSDQAMFFVELTNEEWEYMEWVYCALGWAVNDDVVLDLGFDSDLNIDFDNQIIYDDFDRSWTGLNGHLVSLYVMEETEEYVAYSIPVLYNGKKAVIAGSWIWDETNANNGYYKYNGIYYANEDFSAPNTKFTIDVQPGDEITPTYTTLFGGGEYEGYYEGDPFKVDEDGLYLDFVRLPEGYYYYGFIFIDKYGEKHYTDYKRIHVPSE